ncbi:MAG TPA: type IX secretion system outer membrane channel protein PorV [Hanamia sp.]|jgi:Type IX secretion system protein PorV|nr:type IX secretion system outer membrane channel protein PorV [Hanamia sp.]
MKKVIFKLTALAMLIGTSISVNAQTNPINVVTTAVPFLRISPDARSGGMGDVGVATIPDANSIFWNLSKIPFAKSNSAIALTYTPWLKGLGLNDVYLVSGSGYYQLDDQQAISASLRYFSLGNIQFTDALGNPLQQYRPREFSVDAGYSRKLSDKLGIGIALRYINSNLANGQSASGSTYKTGSAVAGDLSVFNDGSQGGSVSGLNWGATLTNLGSKIGYTTDATEKDFIPANLGLGVAYVNVFDETSKITFGLDVNKLLVPTPPAVFDSAGLANYHSKGVVSSWFSSFGDAPGGFSEELKEFQISVGAEYAYNDQFFFRAGYFYEAPTKGDRKYFTVGAGLNYNMFGLNFSYLIPSGSGINQNPLSNTLRFSILFNLDKSTAAGTTNQ